MELRFDAGQEFQIRAIESVLGLFEGQGRIESTLNYAQKSGFLASPNRQDIDERTILENLQKTQNINGISISKNLECIRKEIETPEGSKVTCFPNFSVEMETGTGKTYVYIRTILELNKRYGFRRFIIVVPSIAIKEGVFKTFTVTQKHFGDLYGNIPYKFYSYESANLSQVREFSTSPNVEIMIMTLDSFNKSMTEDSKGNVIRRPTDRLQGATPIYLVQASKPILILDEPQNMESEISISALASLNPLFALRYSATHRNPYNLIYRLSPAEAYRQGLVKKIEVASVLKENDANLPFIRVQNISSRKRTITASLEVNRLLRSGIVKQAVITVRSGDDLREKTNLPEYENIVVDEINLNTKMILLGNGVEICLGDSTGSNKEEIFEAQIKYTIEEHFRKQKRLRNRGIKVLSLFFIDKVENYASNTGSIRRSFAKAFDEVKNNYPEWQGTSSHDVQTSYFAFTRKKNGRIEIENSSSGDSQGDQAAYDLIMKDKERLLSFDTKEAFVFSHSALREGWDNPNIFQICTLHQTSSEIRKRQEIGRGVRLAVNQSGERSHDPEVNILTVIANQSYERYVQQLQNEIIKDYGDNVDLPPKPANARKPATLQLRKEWVLKPEFKQLWDKIKDKTRYYVKIDSEALTTEVVAELDKLKIKEPRIVVSKVELTVDKEGMFDYLQSSSAKTFINLAGRYPLPNLSEIMAYLLEHTSPPVRLSRKTLVDIYSRTKNKQAAMDNPFEFASILVRVLKEKLADHLVSGIQYEKIGDWWEMSSFKDQINSWEDYAVTSNHSIYDKTEVDSEIEHKFVEDLERIEEVKLYVKLPDWFEVDTPIGKYNPDWAIVWEEHDSYGKPLGKPLLYLVRETKGSTIDKLRPDERRKILCGKKHFEGALGISYKVVTHANEIVDR